MFLNTFCKLKFSAKLMKIMLQIEALGMQIPIEEDLWIFPKYFF